MLCDNVYIAILSLLGLKPSILGLWVECSAVVLRGQNDTSKKVYNIDQRLIKKGFFTFWGVIQLGADVNFLVPIL